MNLLLFLALLTAEAGTSTAAVDSTEVDLEPPSTDPLDEAQPELTEPDDEPSAPDLPSGPETRAEGRSREDILDAMPIRFRGNVVLLPEVYRAVLHYAGWNEAPKDRVARGKWIEQTLDDFLHASGYELASVVVIRDGDGYEALIDEGRLDKIIFRNVDPWTTVQLIFLLDLPRSVFNRDLLEKRMQRVREKMAVERVEYEVVPTDAPNHLRMQIEDPKIIEGLTLLRPGEPHELRVSFERRDRRAGLEVGLGLQPPDGLVVQGSYLAPSVLVRRDRLETAARVGVRLGDIGRLPGNRIGLSQAGLGFGWSTPAIANLLRFTARAEANLEARFREDLRLVNYFFAPIQGELGGAIESEYVWFNLGGGVEVRTFFEPREERGVVVPVLEVTEGSNIRPFARASLSFFFNPKRLRRDRPHEIRLFGRYLWGIEEGQQDIEELRLVYRNTFLFGFDEFRYKVQAAWMDGQVPFYSEVAMGQGFLRAAFQGTVFARKVAALGLEHRLSLSRDTLKFSIFNDVAVYESLDALRRPEVVRLIDNFGVGLHVMLLDAFQIDIFMGLGLRTDGEADLGFSLSVNQAY